MAKALVIKSPLKAWPGKIELPDPNDFSGVHWQTWRKEFSKPSRKAMALVHVYCYSGLELIRTAGEWELEIPIEDVQAWEKAPEDERIKLVAWIGRTVQGYMDEILDPKG